MRFSVALSVVALAMAAQAIPITPAAPELQRRAEQYRLQGLREHEIAAKFAMPEVEMIKVPEPLLTRLSDSVRALFQGFSEDDRLDLSGDIPPGSLEAPEMLPRSPVADNTRFARIMAMMKHSNFEGFAYEGKESELRHPTGMRHWGAEDKWRLF